MKKRSIVVFVLVAIIIFMIYGKLKDKTIYYLNIQDMYEGMEYSYFIKDELKNQEKLEKFVEFKYNDLRVTDLMNMIENNDYIYMDNKKQTIQNALIKADMITLFIGMNEIQTGFAKATKEEVYQHLDSLLMDIEILLKEVRKYSKEEIFFIGYYTELEKEEEYIAYLNQKLQKLCKKEDISYIKTDVSLKKNKNLTNIHQDILREFTFS